MSKSTYVVNFPGHYLGGTAVVRAENKDEAIKIAKKEAKAGGVDIEDKYLTITRINRNNAVLYFYNGDY